MNADPQRDPFESEYVRRPEALGYVRVMEVLREWDPIGVFDDEIHGPRDEYDSYAPTIVRMLDAGKSRDEIVRHLGHIATEHMGLGSFDRLHATWCVLQLIEFWRSWKAWRDAPGSRETHLDRIPWHILDATADDWESLDQIEPHVHEYCGGVDRAGIAACVVELTRTHLLEEMSHDDLPCEAESADDLLRASTEHWFRMTPVGRMLWRMNDRKYCDD